MPASAHQEPSRIVDRRSFLSVAAAVSVPIALPGPARAALRALSGPVRIGVIADLHHDIMHDGPERLGGFIEAMKGLQPDALLQLGDFAYPSEGNREVIDLFNGAHERAYHVIGNHDLDAGRTREDCLGIWGMPARHYTASFGGVQLVVLDGNDSGSPDHGGGYPAYIGEEQLAWLEDRLRALEGPIVVASHQPLAGPWAVDNAKAVQAVLAGAADKVILALNGHSHLDAAVTVGGVPYLHVNSAAYFWVGSDHRHESYPEAVHADHPWISRTCPYRDPLFACLTIDPEAGQVEVRGVRSTWVGPSPADLEVGHPDGVLDERQVVPMIRERTLGRGVPAAAADDAARDEP